VDQLKMTQKYELWMSRFPRIRNIVWLSQQFSYKRIILCYIYSGTCYLETRIWIEILFPVSKAEPKILMYPIRSTYLMRRATFSPKWCSRSNQVFISLVSKC
jgi:hypothetical protein